MIIIFKAAVTSPFSLSGQPSSSFGVEHGFSIGTCSTRSTKQKVELCRHFGHILMHLRDRYHNLMMVHKLWVSLFSISFMFWKKTKQLNKHMEQPDQQKHGSTYIAPFMALNQAKWPKPFPFLPFPSKLFFKWPHCGWNRRGCRTGTWTLRLPLVPLVAWLGAGLMTEFCGF